MWRVQVDFEECEGENVEDMLALFQSLGESISTHFDDDRDWSMGMFDIGGDIEFDDDQDEDIEFTPWHTLAQWN